MVMTMIVKERVKKTSRVLKKMMKIVLNFLFARETMIAMMTKKMIKMPCLRRC